MSIWTPPEDDIVRTYYPTEGVAGISKALDKVGFHRRRPDLPVYGVICDAMRAANQDPTALEAMAAELAKRRKVA